MDFVNQARSVHFNISRFPAQLPTFLAQHAAGDPFAVELATLENSVSQLGDPAETAPLEPQHIAHLDAEALMERVFHLRTALELHAFAYPVNDYYRAVKEEEAPMPPAPEASHLAVFRHDYVVWRMPLEKNEYYLLQQIAAGNTLGEALERVQQAQGIAPEEIGSNFAEWFGRWMRNGILANPDVALSTTDSNTNAA